MELQSCCVSCLISQVEKAYHKLRPDATNEEIVRVQKKVMGKMAQMNHKKMPYYGQVVYQTINQEMQDDDPYKVMKQKYNQKAQQLVPNIRNLLTNCDQPLRNAVAVAILGNTVDFGTPHQIDLEKDVREFSFDQFGINDFIKFKSDFQKANEVLVIGDNCGECVFDKVMLEFFVENYPRKEYIYAVRGGPVINDCTVKDLEGMGFEDICEVVETSVSPGVIFEEASSEYQKVFQRADLIISKGQGNFEALDDVQPPNGHLYFFLKTKCNHVANVLGVAKGALILKRQQKKMES